MFFRCFRIELRKALCNKIFILILIIGIGVTLCSSKVMLETFLDFQERQALSGEFAQAEYNSLSMYGRWIGGEYHTIGMALYFFLFPLFSIMAYGWSYFNEKKSGYIKNVIVRADKRKYILAKYLATFIAGGLAMILPMIFNMFLTCLYSNFAVPDILYGYVCMLHESFGSNLFYTHPFIFSVLYLGIDFIFCGLIACTCMALSFFCKKRLIVLLLPFFTLLTIDYVRWSFVDLTGKDIEISPMRFLHPTAYPQPVKGWLIAVWVIGLLALTLGICLIKGKRDDVF